MKIYWIVSILLVSFCSAVELKPEDLRGVWRVEQDLKEEGASIEIDLVTLFHQDGFLYSEAFLHVSAGEENMRLVTMGGPDLESWKIKDGKLITVTEKCLFDLKFSSIDPEIMKQMMAGVLEELKKPVSYSLVSKSADKLVFKEDEEGTISTYTRIKNDKYKDLLKLKGKKDFDALLGDPQRADAGQAELYAQQMRRLSLSYLSSQKFRAAPSLPLFTNRSKEIQTLRDRREILDRLLCCYLVNFWIILPEKNMPSRNILGLINEFKLGDKLTDAERKILILSRKEAQQKHFNNVGWRMENMMALAWVLGMDQCPDITDGLAGDDQAEMLMPFMNKEVKALKAGKPLKTMRTKREVAQLEDLFYCAHNAVRSAQTGKKGTVPEGFNPMRNGGVISEKRHALTWAISPNVKWDDTNLDT